MREISTTWILFLLVGFGFAGCGEELSEAAESGEAIMELNLEIYRRDLSIELDVETVADDGLELVATGSIRGGEVTPGIDVLFEFESGAGPILPVPEVCSEVANGLMCRVANEIELPYETVEFRLPIQIETRGDHTVTATITNEYSPLWNDVDPQDNVVSLEVG